jgi:hypothetical protein
MKLREYSKNAVGQLVSLRPPVRFLALCLTAIVLSVNYWQINFLVETVGNPNDKKAPLIVRI